MPNMDAGEQLLLIVGRIEGKLDALSAWTTHHEQEDEKAYERITNLEKWRAYLIGGAAAVGALTGTGLEALAKVIGLAQ